MAQNSANGQSPPQIRVKVWQTPDQMLDLRFTRAFRIGRADTCDVVVDNEHVSRNHAEVFPEGGLWRVRDLRSSNGVFIADYRIDTAPITEAATVRLGAQGPEVFLEVEQSQPSTIADTPGDSTIVARYIAHYFDKPAETEAPGEHTMYVRRAFAQVKAKEKRKYGSVMAILALLIVGAGVAALYEHQQSHKQKAMAQELFYTMKSLNVDIAHVEQVVLDSHSPQGLEEIRKYEGRRKQLEGSYDRFLATLHIYDPKMAPREQLILRVARIFGECELDMPPNFVTEINNYIGKWQSSDRLAKAVRAANENGYTAVITRELLAQDLPPQFFYLALQESNFDPYVSGPMTRKGIAKGMWQFIPETAVKYGLHLGPLLDLRRPDPSDDRHHYDRETKAAAKYLKELYTTDAQASGLLVMSCYNWGEDQVLPLVRSMPANPRERNFWRLLSAYHDKIPQETYDYVFYIASAAVIGENPRLFGFNFDNPLASLETK